MFQVSNMFIVSLAVADLIVGLSVMPISTVYIFTGDWPFGVAVCQIWIAIDYIASTASILNLFILSLDRYWSVRAPLQYLHKRTRRRALSMISVVWLASSLWVIPIVGWHYFAHGGVRTVPSDVCDTEYAKDSVFKVVTAFFNFYLPLSVMYALYIRIFIEIRKRSKFELGQRNPGRRRLSYHVKANPIHSQSHDDDDDSDPGDNDTFTDDRSSRDRMTLQDVSMTSLQRFGQAQQESLGMVIRQNGARPKQNSTGGGGGGGGGMRGYSTAVNNGNLRLLAMRRQMIQKEPASSSHSPASPLIRRQPYKVEYVYDENVMDPQTEKLERYYYEDHVDRRCLAIRGSSDRTKTLRQGRSASSKGILPGGTFDSGGRDREESLCSSKLSGAFGGVFVNIHSAKKSRRSNGTASGVGKVRGYGSTPRKSKSKSDPMRKLSISCEVLPSLGKDSRSKCGGGACDSVGCAGIELSSRAEASSSSSSAASTFEDNRLMCNSVSQDDRLNYRYQHQNHTTEGYSLVSGLRRMRLAETFVDQTIIPAEGGGEEDDTEGSNGDDGKRDIFVLRDDKDRRLTGVLNLRHRIIKNLRVSSSLRKEIKAARQLGVIMGAFTLCFLPYFILFLVVAFCDDCIEPGLLTAATWVGYLNSTLNPFLYPLCNIAFRRKFRSMLNFRSSASSSGYNFYERNSMTRARYD
ncbi:hypothetical protein V1264_020440 [Littorina saxatilis]|uniref:G-protein coupled receptors family 1 profile domain-containing protein n=1 Tax=Littorina saxatilis TaxID=31220 RepID=A0AAN9BA25_9CAEN